jgi:hypothetical protein
MNVLEHQDRGTLKLLEQSDRDSSGFAAFGYALG